MITLKDLAAELNVSISTVSRALKGSNEIGKETTKRVLELAQKHHYQPNQIALSLKSRKTKTFGVILPSIQNPFFALVLHYMEQIATQKGYHLITCISNESLEKEQKSMQLLASRNVDGFLLALSKETQQLKSFAHLEHYHSKESPVVLFDRIVPTATNFPSILNNDYVVVNEITNRLISNGKKRIAFISTVDHLSVGALRKKGYLEAINAFESFISPVVLCLNENENASYKIAKLLNEIPEIDAIIAADNTSGTIAINVAQSKGILIPETIEVLGFAREAVSKMTVPSLSYITQNENKIAEEAIRVLLEIIEGKPMSSLRNSTVDATFMARGSTFL